MNADTAKDEAGRPAPLRLLILGAHPDDAEFHAGGLAAAYREGGHIVKMVSVTDGGAGHHRLPPEELVVRRRQEAAAAGAVIGAPYETWNFPDAHLKPTFEVRDRIIREIRTFRPDLVLTHRTNDYHPDHRAVGQAVQAASYLVTVPLVVPDVPFLEKDPVVAYMVDLFRRPYPLQPDVLFDASQYVDTIVRMLACHRSQFFDFLPFNLGVAQAVPESEAARLEWLREWFDQLTAERRVRFRSAMESQWGKDRADRVTHLEVYEISEYAGKPEETRRLFMLDTSLEHST